LGDGRYGTTARGARQFRRTNEAPPRRNGSRGIGPETALYRYIGCPPLFGI